MKQLMILGTFHMESACDVENTAGVEKIDDLQAEIDSLVEQLSAYKPNKVFVELEKKYQDAVDNAFSKYCNGNGSSKNEVVKVAFPLAARNNARVFAVDWMEDGVAIRGCSDVLNELKKYPKLADEIGKFKNGPADVSDGIINTLIKLNSKKSVEDDKAFYINLARVGVDEHYGMGWLLWWYQRNMIIFSNVMDLLEDDDRAILLIGASHKGLLEELFTDSRSVVLADPLDYLQK